MKAVVITLLVSCLISCSSIYEITASPIAATKVTHVVYPVSYDLVFDKSDELFSYHAQHKAPIKFSANANTALLSAKRVASSSTGFEIHLGAVSRSFWRSDYYRVNGDAAQTTGVFRIVFTPTENNQTHVAVIVEKLEVINGTQCCGPHGQYSRYTQVAATTIEEYAILVYIGEQLGIQMNESTLTQTSISQR